MGCEKFMPSLLGQVAEHSADKAGDLREFLGEERRTCDKWTNKEKYLKTS